MKPILEVNDVHLVYSFKKAVSIKKFFLGKEKAKTVEFEALRGLSFSLDPGVNLGIIGGNGAGKSTLLRILAGTLFPDKGSVINRAGSTSLLALGVGFNDELTGHENIYLNGLLLGLSKKEIDDRLEEIIAFSELGEFIGYPVYSYSSGMRSKLAFSIGVFVSPDLFLIDEIFSVGDAHFQQKSSEKMKEMIAAERTVIMVSHGMDSLKEHCHQVLWIENGLFRAMGDPHEIISEYESFMDKKEG